MHEVIFFFLLQDNNEQIAGKLRAAGRTVYSYRVDVTDEQQVIQAANKVKQEVGDVSILINNAGVFSGQPLIHLPSHIIRRCFEVNSMAHFWVRFLFYINTLIHIYTKKGEGGVIILKIRTRSHFHFNFDLLFNSIFQI